jgi:predicted permease
MYMFGAINGYLLKPLPFPAVEQLVHVGLSDPAGGDDRIDVPPHDFLDWRAAQRSLESLAGFYQGTINLSGNERPERFDGAFVSANAISVLRIRPMLGRQFLPGDDRPGAPLVVMLGYDLWTNRYQADPEIVGKVIRANGRVAEVVGVMPQGFRFPFREDVWLPLSTDLGKLKRGEGYGLYVFGRLRPGVSLEQARAEFESITARLAKEYPATNRGLVARLEPYADEFASRGARAAILTMFVAVLLVLLIACANVANLILARTIVRGHELAIRTALGADRWRLVLHMVAECVVVSLLGGALGFWLAHRAGRLTMEVLSSNPDMAPPYWVDFGIDWRSVLFAAGIALAAALAASLPPALRASRDQISAYLRQGGQGMSSSPLGRMSRALVIAQVTLSCVLLICGGLMTRSVINIREIDLRADTANVLTGRIGLFEYNYPDAAAQIRFFETLVERLSTLPGVRAATASTSLPGTIVGDNYFFPEGSKTLTRDQQHRAYEVTAANNYFATFKIPVLEGRGFGRLDRQDSQPVAVVNQMMAERAWPGESPIGRRLRLGRADDQDSPWRTVVGVVPNVVQNQVDERMLPTVYLPLSQNQARFMSIAIRTEGGPLRFAPTFRKAVLELDADLPIYWLRTLDQWIDIGRFSTNFMASLFSIFALVAIALAAIGQYAVLAYTVGQRTREIGLRRALGALDGAILQMLIRQGLFQLAVGLVLGLALSVGFARLLSRELVGVEPFDPLTFGVVLLLLVAVSALAAVLPAHRALRVDPLIALRCE